MTARDPPTQTPRLELELPQSRGEARQRLGPRHGGSKVLRESRRVHVHEYGRRCRRQRWRVLRGRRPLRLRTWARAAHMERRRLPRGTARSIEPLCAKRRELPLRDAPLEREGSRLEREVACVDCEPARLIPPQCESL